MLSVKAPTLMMIGWKDLRVPPPQGEEWVRALNRNGIETLQEKLKKAP